MSFEHLANVEFKSPWQQESDDTEVQEERARGGDTVMPPRRVVHGIREKVRQAQLSIQAPNMPAEVRETNRESQSMRDILLAKRNCPDAEVQPGEAHAHSKSLSHVMSLLARSSGAEAHVSANQRTMPACVREETNVKASAPESRLCELSGARTPFSFLRPKLPGVEGIEQSKTTRDDMRRCRRHMLKLHEEVSQLAIVDNRRLESKAAAVGAVRPDDKTLQATPRASEDPDSKSRNNFLAANQNAVTRSQYLQGNTTDSLLAQRRKFRDLEAQSHSKSLRDATVMPLLARESNGNQTSQSAG